MAKITFTSGYISANGITYTDQGNGTFTMTGTSTGISFNRFYYNVNAFPSWMVFDKDMVVDVSKTGTMNNVLFQIYMYRGSSSVYTLVLSLSEGQRTLNIPSSAGYTGALVRITIQSSNVTVNGSITPVIYTNPFPQQITETTPDSVYTSQYYTGALAGYYAMPNCTRYCYGRWWSLLGYQPQGLQNLGDAETWYQNCTAYQKGQTPKVGAVICFADGPYSGRGHVAIVEHVFPDGSVLFSNSAYRGAMFYLRCGTISSNYHTAAHGYLAYESAYLFQGFIYLPVEFDDIGGVYVPPGPNPSGYGANPLIRYYAKKQIYRNQGRGLIINYHR